MARKLRKPRLEGEAAAPPRPVPEPAPPESAARIPTLQTALGNAGFGRYARARERDSLARDLLIRRSASGGGLQRAPTAEAEPAPAVNVQQVIAAKYPHIAPMLDASHFKRIEKFLDWRARTIGIEQELAAFEQREKEKSARDGRGDSYRFLSSYNDRRRAIESKIQQAPEASIELDTAPLIDRAFIAEQPNNRVAQQQFREEWVVRLSSSPTFLDFGGKFHRDIPDLFSLRWNGRELPTEGGKITWNSLLDLPGFVRNYQDEVENSVVARTAREQLDSLRKFMRLGESEFDIFEVRKERAANPAVGWIAEKVGPDIDLVAAQKLLPSGKKFSDMTPFEIMRFLGSLDEEQVKGLSADLPGYDEWGALDLAMHKAGNAVLVGEYEIALLMMPMIADRAEDFFRRGTAYVRNVTSGAQSVVAGLQAVRTACSVVLTIGGGVAGRAYGLLGVSAGSAAGAGFSTLSQETAMGLSAGNFKAGSVLFKSGKDAAMAFIGSMIGGALAGKFTSMLEGPMAKIISNERWREFVISRIADVGSGLLTQPIDIVAQGMLDGEWPKSLDDLLEKVKDSTIQNLVLGAGVDYITGIKGKAWNELTNADFAALPEAPAQHEAPAVPADPALEAKAAIEASDGQAQTHEALPAAPDPAAAGKQAIEAAHARTEAGAAKPGAAEPTINATQPANEAAAPQMSSAPKVSKTATIVGGFDRRRPLSVSGDAGTKGRTMRRFGVFEGRVKTEDGRELDCVIKVTPKKTQTGQFEPVDTAPDFQAEVEGAIAASQTGLAPRFLGVVEVQGGYAYAMEKVPGGFVRNESQAPTNSAAYRKAEAEAQLTRESVTAQTPLDVENFGSKLLELGYGYHEGELQGLVGHDGRWRPIDFAGIRPLPADPVERVLAIKAHQTEVQREAQAMRDVLEQHKGTQEAGESGGTKPNATKAEGTASPDDPTGQFERAQGDDFAAEEPTQPAAPLPPHPEQMTDAELSEMVAEVLRRPVSPFKETRFYSSYEDFANTFKAKWPDLPVPIAYHDPVTNTMHIGPFANRTTVIHEAVHKVAQDANPQNRALLGDFLNEGITEWLARARLGRVASSRAYETNIAFVEYLAGKVGRTTMENILVHGSYGSFRKALYEALGENRAALDDFFYIMRNMDGDSTDAASLRRLRSLFGD